MVLEEKARWKIKNNNNFRFDRCTQRRIVVISVISHKLEIWEPQKDALINLADGLKGGYLYMLQTLQEFKYHLSLDSKKTKLVHPEDRILPHKPEIITKNK
ncbi:hypothetical protein L1049_002834 [Liquidambar formosana]|uniref:Uncharacterized protein n=1 Tax=Liquidambar formosana TaxID=63359 RepID=A0AAP0R9E4_LIQFO